MSRVTLTTQEREYISLRIAAGEDDNTSVETLVRDAKAVTAERAKRKKMYIAWDVEEDGRRLHGEAKFLSVGEDDSRPAPSPPPPAAREQETTLDRLADAGEERT